MRRQYTAALRSTQVLAWQTQAGHGAHLFLVIAASVIARNVAAQEVLDIVGPRVLGGLYVTVSIVAGLLLAGIGYLARGRDVRSVARLTHVSIGVLLLAAFAGSAGALHVKSLALGKYILIEVAAAALLLVFGLVLGAGLGPREARRMAARVGLGGILGGLFAGLALKFLAPWIGSHYLYVLAALLALAPVFWLPAVDRARQTYVGPRPDREGVGALSPYGRWVAVTTVIMVATTTIVDYQYRAAAAHMYDADRMTSFFGDVTLLTGIATMVLQLTVVDRLLDRFGLFATATVMPAALIICSAGFGLWPTMMTLVALKLVDSGTNMTVQQATGGLLLAPLGPRARAIWQSRIDGLAKRGGQALAGLYLLAFPLAPWRLAPVVLVLCATWLVSVLVTRLRYVRLLTELLGATTSVEPEVGVYDGATLRLLLRELETAKPARAAVILDLLEEAGQSAPMPALERLASCDPTGAAALRVIDHFAALEDIESLARFADHKDALIAASALTALGKVEPARAIEASRAILARPDVPDALRALAAGQVIDRDAKALDLARTLARATNVQTRLAAAQALGMARTALTAEVTPTLQGLAGDDNPEVARAALASLARHPSAEATEIALSVLPRRELRASAMRALSELGVVVVSRVATELVARVGDERIGPALTWVLGRIGSTLGMAPLVTALASPHVETRLSAAVALGTLRRRHPDSPLDLTLVHARYQPEIECFAQMRDASLCDMPKRPAAELLRRAFKQRATASLETLFRILALEYPEDAVQGAHRAITSAESRERQIALELLENLLDAETREALVAAVGERGKKRVRDARKILTQIARGQDRFLAGLTRVVLVEMGLAPRAALGDVMTQLLVNQVLELQALSLFSHSSAEDLAEVATLISPRTVPPRTVLFQQGEAPDLLYLIRSGAVELTRDGRTLDRLGPGDACGIIAILDQLPRETTATAVGECSMLVIHGDALIQLLADRPTLMHGIFRALTGSIRSQLDRVSLERRARG